MRSKLRTSAGEERLNICIVIFPLLEAGITPLSNFVEVLYAFSENLYIFIGNEASTFLRNCGKDNIYIHVVNHKAGTNTATRIMNFGYTQLRISYKLVKIARHIDLWFFWMGGSGLLLPVLIAKLLRKKVVLVIVASEQLMAESIKDSLLRSASFIGKLNCAFANRIILYSPNLIKEWDLEKYRNKISIAHEHFLDFDKFKIKKKFDARKNLVGYIGRLSEEKGVLNFVNAIPEISKERGEIKILVGGDGQLRDKIEKYLDKENLNDKVKLTGWIPHDDLPDCLNELKLVVLPSYTEGLPNIMLEAMACGTPVLATSVGAIPDVIRDGETGFILEDNSPECIAENIKRALNHPDLDKIVKNARELVEKEYTYEAAVERYRKILENLGVKNHE